MSGYERDEGHNHICEKYFFLWIKCEKVSNICISQNMTFGSEIDQKCKYTHKMGFRTVEINVRFVKMYEKLIYEYITET